MASARPYRFPVPAEGGERRDAARRPVVRDVRRVGGGELRGAVLLPVRRGGLPHAGLVKAPYAAGRRCVVGSPPASGGG